MTRTLRRHVMLLALPMVLSAAGIPVHAYVDLAPTLAKLITDSKSVSLVQVVNFDREKRTVVLTALKTFKGDKPAGEIQHQVASSETAIVPRAILQWAEPGAQAILFTSGRTAVVCIGEAWYQLKLIGSTWKLGVDRPELALSYYGSVPRLADGIEKMVAGRDAILTMMPHGVDKGASFDLALNTSALPGLVTVQRLRANMTMPTVVFSVSNSLSYRVGMGPVDEADLPTLLANFKSTDAAIRAESADDLRQLTEVVGAKKTGFAVPALEALLDDSVPRVRLTAAGTILRITHGHARALGIIDAGLRNEDAGDSAERGKGGGYDWHRRRALVDKLGAMMKDKDEGARVAALQALATLGPVAAGARDAVAPLLEESDYMMDAADALGRMGPRAQPVPAQMVKMLDSDQAAVRWAAIRGMSQIGGEAAIPAAQFIAREIGKASETDAYNMVIYLAMIGPPAREAAATIKSVPIINPVLPQATNWAMNCDVSLPWQNNAISGFGDVGNFIFAAYVTALGERLRPAALKLAPLLVAGKAGADVPEWGYKILNAAPVDSVATVAPHLADADKKMRERAAYILGFMGPPAVSAKEMLEKALAAASDEREKKLIAWSLEEVTRD